jgi:hypothetical protein
MSRKIILHTLNFEKFWAHYSLIHDPEFISTLYKRGYTCEFSKNTIIEKDDIVLFIESNSIGIPLFIFSELTIFRRIKFFIKFILKIKIYLKRYLKKMQIKKQNCFLLVLESELHSPENHVKSLNKFCNKIFTWNDNLIKEPGFIKINIPQPRYKIQSNKFKFFNKKLLVNISSNKFSNSRIEIYSKRLQSISFFDKFHPNEFDLYGFDWNRPNNIYFNTYKGTVEDKISVMSQYRFAIIYENCRIDGYITEKIFDCFYSKCVPIYLGAPNINKYIPSDCFIDRDIFQNDEHLYNFISKINETQHEVYLNNIYKFLNSSQYTKFLTQSLAETMLNEFEII